MTTSEAKIESGGLSVQGRSSVTRLPVRSSSTPRRNAAIIFLREFTRELIREISPATKTAMLLIFASILIGIFYLGRSAYMSYRAQQQQHLRLIGEQRKRIDEQGNQLGALQKRLDESNQLISALERTDSDLSRADREVLDNLSLATRLWSRYNTGVCLIAGSYIFVEPGTGRPFRYPEERMSEEERLLTIGTGAQLTTSGNGSIFELEYVGTGFHTGDGYVLTNRHVANNPWKADPRAQYVISITGGEPRLKKLLAFFPNQRQAFALKFKNASQVNDLAVCKLDVKALSYEIPALPLDENANEAEVGQRVVMMGYPNGPARMLALLPEEESVGIQRMYGSSLFALVNQLAKRKVVKPLTTQGHITDLYTNRIVFDAATSEGASGTPMFGESGKVVGVTFAIFVENEASNFAVPITEGFKLLRKAGWRPKKNLAENAPQDSDG